MTWTYSTDPAISDKDAVRFLVGDTDSDQPLVQDAEIAFALAEEGGVYAAAAAVARAIAAIFSRKADETRGRQRVAYLRRSNAFADRARELAGRTAALAAAPIATGLTFSGREAALRDTDRVPEHFRVGQHDNLRDP